jgi:iron complex outermembrane receptor protein
MEILLSFYFIISFDCHGLFSINEFVDNQMRRISFLTVCIILTMVSTTFAQVSDTIKYLDAVEITGSRLKSFSVGRSVKTISVDSKKLPGNGQLNYLLERSTSLNLKSYGVAGLSNAGLRGTGSKHTAVLWNGFNLQSPLSSECNLFNISSFMVDELSIHTGASSSLFGSGAMGGAIHLNNKPSFKEESNFKIQAGIGSYGKKSLAASASFSDKNFHGRVRYHQSEAANDFEFVNISKHGSPIDTQFNAAYEQKNLLLEQYFRISNKSKLNFMLWLSETDRETPGRMDQSVNEETIEENALRVSTVYQYTGVRSMMKAKTAFFMNDMKYDNPVTGLFSRHLYYSSITELEYRYMISDMLILNTGLFENYTFAESRNLIENPKQNRLAAFASLKFKPTHYFNVIINGREELTDSTFSIPTFSVGSELLLWKSIFVKASLARSYNIPSFNDLFWKGGFAYGNPDLVPESGWNKEASLDYVLNSKKTNFKASIGVYDSHIENLIRWIPVEGKWTPVNKKKVWTRGIESSVNIDYSISKWKFSLQGDYTYTRATQERVDEDDDVNTDYQLAYTPKHSLNSSLDIGYRWIHLAYTHSWISENFTSDANQIAIDPYELDNLSVYVNAGMKNMDLALSFRVNNLYSESYQLMYMYAMPTRNYELSIIINYKQPNN